MRNLNRKGKTVVGNADEFINDFVTDESEVEEVFNESLNEEKQVYEQFELPDVEIISEILKHREALYDVEFDSNSEKIVIREYEVESDSKELLALVNTKPNRHLSGTHKDLTIVNRPEAMDTPAIYQENKLEKAEKDREKFENSHIKIKKLTVEEVNQ